MRFYHAALMLKSYDPNDFTWASHLPKIKTPKILSLAQSELQILIPNCLLEPSTRIPNRPFKLNKAKTEVLILPLFYRSPDFPYY